MTQQINLSEQAFLNLGDTLTLAGTLIAPTIQGSTAFQLTTGAVSGYVLTSDASGNGSWVPPSVTGAAGSDKFIQFNQSGAFGASSNLVWDYTSNRLGIDTATPSFTIDIANVGGNVRLGTSTTYARLDAGSIGVGAANSSLPGFYAQETGGFNRWFMGFADTNNDFGIYWDNTPNFAMLITPGTTPRTAIGKSAADASAILDVQSTTLGFLAPRMTTTQKNSIASPATGLEVYDTTLNQFSYWNGSVWTAVGAVSSVAGTSNQISASPVTGNVVLSIPSIFIAPGSIQATTTITGSGNMMIDGTTFNVDAGNHRVGVATSTPGFTFDIGGHLTFDNTNPNYLMTIVNNTPTAVNPALATPTTNLKITSGNSSSGVSIAGGGILVTSGDITSGNGRNSGGNITLSSGATANAPTFGGNLILTAGLADGIVSSHGSNGGSITLTSGGAPGSQSGGSITLTSGNASGSGNTASGGSITLTSGTSNGSGTNTTAGGITLTCGQAQGAGSNDTPGNLTLTSFTPSRGGNLSLTGTGASHGTITAGGNMSIDGTTFNVDSVNHQIGIGTLTPDASASIDVTSTTRGLLMPRMTTTQKNAISSPATGLEVYDTTLNQVSYWNGSVWVNSATGAIAQNTYTVGTPSGTYTGSTTLFNLPFTYIQDGKSLQVMYNGQVLVSGVDYNETSSTSVTFITALTTGYTAVFRSIVASTPANSSVNQFINYIVGTASGTYSGSTTVFALPFAYVQDGKSLQVMYDGVQLIPGDDYTETSTTSITTTQALVSGQKIAFRTQSGAIIAAAVTKLRENYVVGTASGNYTGSLTTFNLINSYTPGGINLEVYLDGDLQTVGASIDYLETNTTTVTFNNALVSGQKVTFLFSQAVGTGTGVVSSATSGQLAYYPSSGSTISGSSKISEIASGLTVSTAANPVVLINDTGDGTQVEIKAHAGGNAHVGTITNNGFQIIANNVTAIDIATGNGSAAAIRGTNTNDNAQTGFVGEQIQSVLASTTFPSTANGTFTNITSINLTAGDWDVTAILYVANNGTAFTAGTIPIAISLFSGNTTTDHKNGDNAASFSDITSTSIRTMNIPSYRISLAAPATVYFKTSAGTTNSPPAAYRLSARRMR